MTKTIKYASWLPRLLPGSSNLIVMRMFSPFFIPSWSSRLQNGSDVFYSLESAVCEQLWLLTLHGVDLVFLLQLGHYHVVASHAFFEAGSFVHWLDHAYAMALPAFKVVGPVHQLKLHRDAIFFVPFKAKDYFQVL